MRIQADSKIDQSSAEPALHARSIEVIDSAELAKRLGVPESWVRSHTNPHRTTDVIPHLRFGRYVRFDWCDEALHAWLNRQRVSTNRAGQSRRNG
jgi:hypothetical protein